MARDFYENKEGEIVEVRIRPIELADKFLEIQIRAAATNPLSEIAITTVDCGNLDAIYQQIHDSDQQVRTGGGGDMNITDSLNRQTVISTIFTCYGPEIAPFGIIDAI